MARNFQTAPQKGGGVSAFLALNLKEAASLSPSG